MQKRKEENQRYLSLIEEVKQRNYDAQNKIEEDMRARKEIEEELTNIKYQSTKYINEIDNLTQRTNQLQQQIDEEKRRKAYLENNLTQFNEREELLRKDYKKLETDCQKI